MSSKNIEGSPLSLLLEHWNDDDYHKETSELLDDYFDSISKCDFYDIADEGVRIANMMFYEDIEAGSPASDVYHAVSAAAYDLAIRDFATLLKVNRYLLRSLMYESIGCNGYLRMIPAEHLAIYLEDMYGNPCPYGFIQSDINDAYHEYPKGRNQNHSLQWKLII